MNAFVSLRTERLLIDRLSPGDVDAIVSTRNDPSVARFQSWPLPYTAEHAVALVAATVPEGQPLTAGGQLAIRTGDGALIGDLAIQRVVAVPHAIELGITLNSTAQGRGYAAEAVAAISAALFAVHGEAGEPVIHKLIAIVDTANTASLRLFDRQGFRREGVTRDSYRLGNGDLTDEVLFGLTRREWSRPPTDFDVIAFDADDTLWQSEDSFHAAEQSFVDLVSPYVSDGIDVRAALTATERRNLHIFGYGVRAFGLSMVEAATSLGADRGIPARVIGQLVEMVREMLTEPVQLLPGVAEVLEVVGRTHRLVLVTKGDLVHQTAKVEMSGLAHHFEQIEIVMEKDAPSYERIITSLGVPPKRFCMVGNSVRSDILPVLSLGASAVHVPYHLLWDLEQAPHDHGRTFAELQSISELPQWLTASTTARAE